MEEIKLGLVEAKFAEMLWREEPITTRDLVKLCEREFNWKRTTTYTVLKKLCDKGIFQMDNSVVTALISKEEFYAMQSETFVENTFQGSLPAFIAAFTSRRKLSSEEMESIKRMIDSSGEE